LRTLVLGLGNPILTDDGAGIKVTQILREEVHDPDVDMLEATAAGLDLLDLIVGYDRLIVVDTIRTGCCAPGTILRLSLDDFELAQHLSSPHDIGFKELIELGRRLGLHLPSEILIYAIEAQDTATFGETFTSEIARAVPQVANMIISERLQVAYYQ
jgi:hydrogenase maturation protease